MARPPPGRRRHPVASYLLGAPWRDVPELYGPWQTCYDRFVRWRQDGAWEMLSTRLQSEADASGELEWTVSVDSTVARPHQRSAGARWAPSSRTPMQGRAHERRPDDPPLLHEAGEIPTLEAPQPRPQADVGKAWHLGLEARRSIASATGTNSRSSSICLASVARLSSRRIRTRSATIPPLPADVLPG